jgi:hypothetical protein
MLWQYIITGTKGRFEGHSHPQQPPQKTRLLGELSDIHPTRWHGVQGLMWGTRGPFLPAAAIFVAVATPVVFVLICAKATEKCNKNTKISCL